MKKLILLIPMLSFALEVGTWGDSQVNLQTDISGTTIGTVGGKPVFLRRDASGTLIGTVGDNQVNTRTIVDYTEVDNERD